MGNQAPSTASRGIVVAAFSQRPERRGIFSIGMANACGPPAIRPFVDVQVGRVLDAPDRLELATYTAVVFVERPRLSSRRTRRRLAETHAFRGICWRTADYSCPGKSRQRRVARDCRVRRRLSDRRTVVRTRVAREAQPRAASHKSDRCMGRQCVYADTPSGLRQARHGPHCVHRLLALHRMSRRTRWGRTLRPRRQSPCRLAHAGENTVRVPAPKWRAIAGIMVLRAETMALTAGTDR